ncbi:AMP-binding protein [Streptomyces sp. NPDC053367]|uniref:AMP-binding protein n=1 Tax=Streptomyces sp. NPDC053367 TaxID=3365700 RepID=UPI0037D9880F
MPPLTLDAVFSAVAHARPGATAVREGTDRLSYGRAEIKATQLATALVRGGVQLGDPVVVSCADHAQTLVAHLAVFKAGGVCVPVARNAGRKRCDRIARVSGAQAVLCSAATRGPWARQDLVLALDDEETRARVNALRVEPALPLSGALDASYLLPGPGYGRDLEGQLADHTAWGHLCAARTEGTGLPAAGAVAVRRAPGEPVALSAMWWVFANGGTLVTGADADAVDRTVLRGEATAVVLSPEEYPGVLDALEAAGDAVGPRAVVLVGEPCPDELVERHFAVLPDTRLRAEFAPVSGVLPWTARDFAPPGPPAAAAGGVGRPVPQVQVWVLDPHGEPLPPGRKGRLWAGGAAVPFDSVRADHGRQAPPDAGVPLRSDWLGVRRADGTVETVARK